MDIPISYENERGCGYRQPGGYYLMGNAGFTVCKRLPIPLTTCPTCSAGIAFSKAFQWVDGSALVATKPCSLKRCDKPKQPKAVKDRCLLGAYEERLKRCGLLWVGEGWYNTPEAFANEARELGISKRLNHVPKGLVPNETIVLLAHRKAVQDTEDAGKMLPGIFTAFIPRGIEYVYRGDETERELKSITDRGISIVKVKPEFMRPVDPSMEG